MKLLLDEQITYKVAEPLRDQGYDVMTVVETPSLSGSSDRDVFEFAQAERRAVVTYDVADFMEIARDANRLNEAHCGLVFVHSKRLPNSNIGGLVTALGALLADPPRETAFVTWLQPSA